MGFWSGTKKVLGHIVDVRVDRWLDLETLKTTHKIYVKQAKQLLTFQHTRNAESFERALDRLEISPEELQQQAARQLFMCYFFLLLAAALFVYALITLYLRNWMGVFMNFALIVYALSLAFRYHFWYFQITQKKLGCTPTEWYKFTLLGKRKDS